MLADYKLQVLDRVPDNYFRNVEKVKAAAAKAGLELVPAVFSIGYSNGHLSHDPNLAEGLPVVDQPYRRQDAGRAGRARGRRRRGSGSPVATGSKPSSTRSGAQIRNGSLEETQGDRFLGFSFQDDPGVATFADRSVVHEGRVSCRLEPGPNGQEAHVAQRPAGAARRAFGRTPPTGFRAG